MCPEMTDKAVATEADFQGEGQWKMVQLESLLAALVDSKVVAMKADHGPGYLRYHNQPHHHHHHRHHRTPTRDHRRHGHKRCRHHEERAKCKVRQWDDGTATLVHDPRMTDDRYVTVEMEDSCEHSAKKKRRKRRRNVGPIIQHPIAQVKVVDPEDLPKRARWTIIITAGFLLLTCMLLVGVTLRMAPIIDEMVNTQNVEHMNSLNRQETDINGTVISR